MTTPPVTTTAPMTGPRWGEQTSFVQRHQKAFWLFVVVIAITGLDFLAQQLQMISGAPTAWFLTVILLVPYAIPVVAIIYYLDLYEREPISILVAALLWGGIAATTLSIYTNTPLAEIIFKLTGDPYFTADWAAALTAPFVEELFKGLAIVLLISIARNELDDILDGFIWGAMVGIGFLLVEDVIYFVRAFAETGSLVSVFQMWLIRIVGAGPYSHFLYTGLVGMGMAYYVVRLDKPKSTRLLMAIGLIAAGVGAHFLWNSPILTDLLGEGDLPNWAIYVTVKGLPMLIGLILVVRLARNRERRWFASLASGFHDDGAITPEEVATLGGVRARRAARNAAGREKGPAGKQIKGRLQREQLLLAMAFNKHGSESHPDVVRHMAEVMSLKAQYAALGAGAAAVGAAAWAGAAPQPVATQPAAAQPGWGQPAATAAAVAATQPGPAVEPSAQPAWGQPAATAAAVAATQPGPAAEPVAAQPEIRPQPAPPPVVPTAPAWAPTHEAPPGGMPAWSAPNPALAPSTTLAAGLDLAIAERAGDWARVVAVNGWTGWVDARRLAVRP